MEYQIWGITHGDEGTLNVKILKKDTTYDVFMYYVSLAIGAETKSELWFVEVMENEIYAKVKFKWEKIK